MANSNCFVTHIYFANVNFKYKNSARLIWFEKLQVSQFQTIARHWKWLSVQMEKVVIIQNGRLG